MKLIKFYKKDRVTLFIILTFLILVLFSFLSKIFLPQTLFGRVTIIPLDLTSDFYNADISDTTKIDVTASNCIDSNQKIISGVKKSPQLASEKVEGQTQETANITTDQSFVCFEDYSTTNELQKIVTSLKSLKKEKKAMRIAFLGDSFIEADILTEDIRTQLQAAFGGQGVGFIPITSVASKYRNTIEENSTEWKSFSMVKFNEADWKRLTLTGFYYTASEGSTFSVKTKKEGQKEVRCSSAKLLFVNEKNTEIKVSVNGGNPITYNPKPDIKLQTVDLHGSISSLDFSFSNVDGFYGYGLLLNDTCGVYVDNYSVRGSSGIVLSTFNDALSHEFASVNPTDVIVLQYGLNVVAANVTNYNYYEKKMVKIINRLRSIFPKASFIIMGVGDRSMKSNNTFETMPGILALIKFQRQIAKTSGCIFWDTYSAMGGKNSMSSFVAHNPPLANKDYTHINHLGGKKIANAFVNSILREVETASLTEQKNEGK